MSRAMDQPVDLSTRGSIIPSSLQLRLPMRFRFLQLWPFIAGFWLLALGGAWASPGWGNIEPFRTEGLVFFAFAVAPVLLIGSLLLGDGPRSPGSFWRTRPLSRSAVWDGKLAAVVGWVGLPMVLGHALVLWRMGLPTELFLPALARAISGLALFAAWFVALAIPSRRWSELLVGSLVSYVVLARAIRFLFTTPLGALLAQALVAVGLIVWLLFGRSLRSGLRWTLFVILAAAVGIGSYPLVLGNDFTPADTKAVVSTAAESGPAIEAADLNVTLEPVVGRQPLADGDPFLCAQLDVSRLVSGFAYELEPSEIRLADLYLAEAEQAPIYPSVWWIPTPDQLGAEEPQMLPTEARLRLSRRLPAEQLVELRHQWQQGMYLEVRGTLRRLEVTPSTTLPLEPGASVLGPGGRISLVELDTFNRRLGGILAEPVSWRHSPLVKSRDERSWVRMEYGPVKDHLWVGANRSWALRLPQVSPMRHVSDSYLAPFSGIEIRLSKFEALNPVGAARLDLPGSNLVIYERRELGEASVTLRLIPAAFDDLLCRRLPPAALSS